MSGAGFAQPTNVIRHAVNLAADHDIPIGATPVSAVLLSRRCHGSRKRLNRDRINSLEIASD
jgi:hypothetical protein